MSPSVKLASVLALTLLAPTPLGAADAVAEESPDQLYAELLREHVEDGLVDYRGLAKRDLGKLDRYLAHVAKARLPKAKAARVAALVDAYNALVLRAVIRHGRPRSVLDVKGFFDAEVHRVAGRELTLDQLEKTLIGPLADDPRTHFVLVCGAVGCPILEPSPYAGSDLDALDARMEAATRRYLRSPRGARVEPGQLRLSKIFDWYAADFGGPEGARAFVRARLTEAQRARLGPSPTVGFIDYDWSLNQR